MLSCVTKQTDLIIELTILLQSESESRFNNHYANSTNKHLNIRSISHSNCHALISSTWTCNAPVWYTCIFLPVVFFIIDDDLFTNSACSKGIVVISIFGWYTKFLETFSNCTKCKYSKSVQYQWIKWATKLFLFFV